jgi:hypothetical protein
MAFFGPTGFPAFLETLRAVCAALVQEFPRDVVQHLMTIDERQKHLILIHDCNESSRLGYDRSL